MLTLEAPCTLLCRTAAAPLRLRELAEMFTADAVDPKEYKCLRCGCEWEREYGYDWKTAACSNCYSERVIVTVVRLGFENWGEQNGGESEQRQRYENALRNVATAMRALKIMRQ